MRRKKPNNNKTNPSYVQKVQLRNKAVLHILPLSKVLGKDSRPSLRPAPLTTARCSRMLPTKAQAEILIRELGE